jgi:hypothetical protein
MRRINMGLLASVVGASMASMMSLNDLRSVMLPPMTPVRPQKRRRSGSAKPMRNRSKYTPHIGKRQRERMARQIAAGQIKMMGD